MIFKEYQKRVSNDIREYFVKASELKTALANIPNVKIDWVHNSFTTVGLENVPDSPKNGLGEHYPRFCIKMPTGGGKTLLAVDTIRQYQELFVKRKTGLVVWVVPSDIIYTQTIESLRDKSHPYRQMLDQASGGHTVIVEKGQELRIEDVEENLVVLMLMIQSVSRKTNKASLKVFSDSGAYGSFFPEDSRFDLHKELLEKIPNLDTFHKEMSLMPQVKTSLGNVVRLTNPLIIIDEIHKVFSETARKTINNLNPAMVVGLSATPKSDMNILISVTGQELKDEEMIKLDMNIKTPTQVDDWQTMIKDIKDLRDSLEEITIKYKADTGEYIRPISLIQVERTGNDQRGKKFVHSEDVKEYLIDIGIPAEQIAIKSSSKNDIEDIDLLSKDSEIRWIITRDALKEGWDCPFAYLLGIIPNVNSNTGVTQLVGRILRQPFGRKTGIQDLDESYVFFTKGKTIKILSQIERGFKEEGLGDLVGGNSSNIVTEGRKLKTVKIKRNIKEKYTESLYLPIWLIEEEKKQYREFNYSIDIKPLLNFESLDAEKIVEDIIPALSNQKLSRALIKVDLENGKFLDREEKEFLKRTFDFDVSYLTRRINNVIENAFLSRKIAEKYFKILKHKIEEDKLSQYNGFIVSEIVRVFQEAKLKQESEIFKRLVDSKKLILALSDNGLGFRIPETDTINEPRYNNTFNYYLYDDFDISSLNGLEADVAQLLENQEKILWWVRNKASKGWYAIQGWQQNKIRPDFVVARKGDNGKLDLMYVIESKGKHLVGNEDTDYKQTVFEFMNDYSVEQLQDSLIKVKRENDYYFELVEENKYENQIRTTLNRSFE